jgi:hypothetical protein
MAAIPPATPEMWNWFVEAPVAPAAIPPLLAVVLGRPVVPLHDADPDDLPPRAVLCDIWTGVGDFPVGVDCYAPPDDPPETVAAARLARRLGRGVLLPDDTLDPGRHVLATPDALLRPVHLDLVDTDEGEARVNLRACAGSDPWAPCRESRWTPDRVVHALIAA